MECQLFCLLVCAVIGASYAGSYYRGRGYGWHGDGDNHMSHGSYHGRGYGYHGGHHDSGDQDEHKHFRGMMHHGTEMHQGHGPPRHAFFHGSIYKHEGERHHSDSDSDSHDGDDKHYHARRSHHSDSEDGDDKHRHVRRSHHSQDEDDDRQHRRHYRRHHSDSESEDDDHKDSHDSDDDHHDDNHHDDDHHHDDRIWRFQIGDSFGAYEYLDEEGHAQGFYIDLLKAVCKKAHKRCYFVLDAYHNCWNTQGGQELPGIGLLDHWYDGCIGLLPTPDRLNSFNFTVAFTPHVECALHYKSTSTRTDKKNVTGLNIGFVDGWALSKRCFERQTAFTGNEPGKYHPRIFETHQHMITALMKDEIDAVLTVDVFDASKLGLKAADPPLSCTTSGGSVMAMYGSEVIEWWNDAFLHMKDDGSFRRLCAKAAVDHGDHGDVHCALD